eukprot:m51a1_g7228 hypothetical protein (507) ;mRNA; r:24833-27447
MEERDLKRRRVLHTVELTADEEALFGLLLDVARSTGFSLSLRAAGGWVRDKLLGRPSTDIDIALEDCSGAEFAGAVARRLGKDEPAVIRANPEQSKHLETATMRVPGGMSVDFVNLRAEEYADRSSRIPTVRRGTPLEDAQRRDLTINALFYNLHTREVEDLTGRGVSDLREGLIRTPLEPLVTLEDDPLRALRAVRFSARLGFPFDDALAAASRDPRVTGALAQKISRERIGHEVALMLAGPRPGYAVAALLDLGLLDAVLAVPTGAQGDALARPEWRREGAACVRQLERVVASRGGERTAAQMLAALLWPLRACTCAGDKRRPVPLVQHVVMGSLKLSNKDLQNADLLQRSAEDAVALAAAPAAPTRGKLGMAVRRAGGEWPRALELAAASQMPLPPVPTHDSLPSDPLDGPEAEVLAKYEALARQTREMGLEGAGDERPVFSGKDLAGGVFAGARPGAWLGAVLDRELEWQLDHPGCTPDDARAFLLSSCSDLVPQQQQQKSK